MMVSGQALVTCYKLFKQGISSVNLDAFFNDSYERVSNIGENGNLFFDCFYEKFVGSSPEIKDKFRNTDMKKQKLMLRSSILYIMQLFSTHELHESLQEIAIKHDQQHMDIRPELYDIWIECLIDTVRELDPYFDERVELAWRLVFSPGITYMKFNYEINNIKKSLNNKFN
jgi:hemoglobin-like flavoprotein